MSQNFYRAFEDKFRGSRELILSRLDIYRPFVEPLKTEMRDACALDLGCGRGEWLELLRKIGLPAKGVDLDTGMLEACKQMQLDAQHGDAISCLLRQPSESVSVVSAFHLVEHLPFDQLQQLVQEALRVLQPGGLLIMETPNPENIEVGSHTFYYDPTHQRPLPPLLLSFIPEFYGFHRTKILRLQEVARLRDQTSPRLMEVLGGVSPDYAVIAQKAGQQIVLSTFDSAFSSDHGLTLGTLASRYDAQHDRTRHASEQAVSLAQRAIAVASQTQEQIAGFEKTIHRLAHENQCLAAEAEQRIQTLLTSTSWRVTAPLRELSTQFGRLQALTKSLIRSVLLVAMRFVLRRPNLQKRFSRLLKRFPGIAYRLHLMAAHRGLVQQPDAIDGRGRGTDSSADSSSDPISLLTPHARHIRDDLSQAIAEHEKSAREE